MTMILPAPSAAPSPRDAQNAQDAQDTALRLRRPPTAEPARAQRDAAALRLAEALAEVRDTEEALASLAPTAPDIAERAETLHTRLRTAQEALQMCRQAHQDAREQYAAALLGAWLAEGAAREAQGDLDGLATLRRVLACTLTGPLAHTRAGAALCAWIDATRA